MSEKREGMGARPQVKNVLSIRLLMLLAGTHTEDLELRSQSQDLWPPNGTEGAKSFSRLVIKRHLSLSVRAVSPPRRSPHVCVHRGLLQKDAAWAGLLQALRWGRGSSSSSSGSWRLLWV